MLDIAVSLKVSTGRPRDSEVVESAIFINDFIASITDSSLVVF
jgi:hypothetical protein